MCAANALRTSGARGTGWVMIAFGWGFAVFVGASIADRSGAHLNPAVTVALAVKGGVGWDLVPAYFAGQFLGAFTGAVGAWAAFKQLFDANNRNEAGEEVGGNADTGGIFFTGPAHPNNFWNAVTEFIGTYALLMFILVGPSGVELGSLKYMAVAIAVVAIGFALGSPTGNAINPARDLGPPHRLRLRAADQGQGKPKLGLRLGAGSRTATRGGSSRTLRAGADLEVSQLQFPDSRFSEVRSPCFKTSRSTPHDQVHRCH